MLDVDPRAASVKRVEVEPGELQTDGAMLEERVAERDWAASFAVGRAEFVNGTKSENRVPSASAVEPERIRPHDTSVAAACRCLIVIDFMFINWNVVLMLFPKRFSCLLRR